MALPAALVKDLDRLDADSFFLDAELLPADDLVVYDLLEIDGTKISGLAYQTRCEHRHKLINQGYRRSHISIVSTWKTGRAAAGRRSLDTAGVPGMSELVILVCTGSSDPRLKTYWNSIVSMLPVTVSGGAPGLSKKLSRS